VVVNGRQVQVSKSQLGSGLLGFAGACISGAGAWGFTVSTAAACGAGKVALGVAGMAGVVPAAIVSLSMLIAQDECVGKYLDAIDQDGNNASN
jgi:hypothetical protein